MFIERGTWTALFGMWAALAVWTGASYVIYLALGIYWTVGIALASLILALAAFERRLSR